ncbi:MAG: DUF1501 domain-containing protein [Phycisphaerae bacterium]|jgi:uncharacterized protein (DUF1501 family)
MDENILQSCGCREYRDLARILSLDRNRPVPTPIGRTKPQPAWAPRVVLADSHMSRDVLVLIFLRGGMDGLTTVVPHGDTNYYTPGLRPTLSIPPPGEPGGAVDLDGFFGLAPAMGPLFPAYDNGDLLVVHATGSPDPTRSHFDAFQYMEYGIPLQPLATFTGWLARHLQVTAPASAGPLRGIALSDLMPRTLSGAPETLPIPDPANFQFPGRQATAAERQAALQAAYAAASEPLSSAATNTIDTIDLLAGIDFDNYAPEHGAVYPNTAFGQALESVAALIKAEVGVEVAMVERTGWDTHSQQAGAMQLLMTDLADSAAAFHTDMQDLLGGITLVAMSEFGRRADENGSAGCDHGHGNCMFVMGGNIAGGQVLADWTNDALLHPDLLYQGDSLQVTIDYRDILAEILENRLENTDLATVFPNHAPTFHGVTA